jgi:heat shock protein HtpX
MAASFYSQIAANRRNSFLLVLIIVLLLAALGAAIGYGTTGAPEGTIGWLGIFGIVAIVSSLIGYFNGDRVVLAASRARPATEAEVPQLINVVRELTLAAGIPMPSVYLIDDTALNAFATGRDPAHASIAVTTGLVARLDREELQGVVGHELSHVRNYDIRYAMLVGVLVGTIALVADVFLRMTFWGGFGRRSSSSSDRGGGGGLQAIVFMIAILLAILAPFFARLVQLAVSRQREYLADSSSVELTRNPYGLQRALAVIAEDHEVLEVANRATQHLYFRNPIRKFEDRSKGLFSTHPPLVDRINRLRALSGEAPIDAAGLPGVQASD